MDRRLSRSRLADFLGLPPRPIWLLDFGNPLTDHCKSSASIPSRTSRFASFSTVSVDELFDASALTSVSPDIVLLRDSMADGSLLYFLGACIAVPLRTLTL